MIDPFLSFRASGWRGRHLLWGLPSLLLIAAQLRTVASRPAALVPGTLDGADAMMQSGILAWTVRHLGDPAAALQLPIFYPAQRALVGMDTLFGQALMVAPLHWLGVSSPALLYNVAVAGSLLLTAIAGAALWLATAPRHEPGRRAAGAGLCALLLLGAPFTTWQLGMLNQISPPWVVFMLACLWRGWVSLERDGRVGPWWWLGGACLVVQAAWGWYGLADAVFVLSTLGVVGLVLAQRRGRLGRMLAAAWPPAVVAAGLVLALAWPYLQQRAEAGTYTRELPAVQHFGSDLHVLGNLGAHRWGWQDVLGAGPALDERLARHAGAVMHPGWVVLCLALLAVWSWRRWSQPWRRAALAMVAVGLVGFVMSFGDSVGVPPGSDNRIKLPFGVLWDLVVPFRAFRAPSRFYFLVTIAVSWWATAGAVHGRWRFLLPAAAVLVWLESVPVAMLAVPVPVSATAVETTAPAPAVLAVPVPADEAGETVHEALWLHRALVTGAHYTDGMSGWVPPVTRRLRLRLGDCEAGELTLPVLLDSLRREGIVAVELNTGYPDTSRVRWWQEELVGAGFGPGNVGQQWVLYPLQP